MQIPSAPVATIDINEEHDVEDGKIILSSNNIMDLQRYICKIVLNGVIFVLLCAVAFIIYEYRVIISHYLGKLRDSD